MPTSRDIIPSLVGRGIRDIPHIPGKLQGPGPGNPGPAPPKGFVRLWSDDAEVIVGLGAEPPQQTQGYGGWEEIDRKRRKSLTIWKGRAPRRIVMALLFDVLGEEESGPELERDIRVLESFAGEDQPVEPPLVNFDSGGFIPNDFTDAPEIRWLLDGIDWGDAIRDSEGQRERQEASITLLEYVPDQRVEELPPAAKRREASKKGKCKGAKSKRYTVKKGDTLVSIAKAQLHDADCWKAIGNANEIRDPRAPLKVGRNIRLP